QRGATPGSEGLVVVDLPELGRAAGRAELVEEVDVGVVVALPLLGGVVLVEDRLDRADRLTSTAVDALVGGDVEHALALVDAVDRTLVDAGPVLEVDARLGDDVGHQVLLNGKHCSVAPKPSIPGCPPQERPTACAHLWSVVVSAYAASCAARPVRRVAPRWPTCSESCSPGTPPPASWRPSRV